MEVDHDAHSDLHEEDDEEEGEEGSQHPGGLLPGAAAAQEAHDGDDGPNTEENIGAQVVVSLLVCSGLQVEITGQDISPGGYIGLFGVSKYQYFSLRKLKQARPGEMDFAVHAHDIVGITKCEAASL